MQPIRYFVMYDHSTFDTIVKVDSEVHNLVTWVVSSHSDMDEAMAKAHAIRSGNLDLFTVPGPWHSIAHLYDEPLDEEYIV